MAPMHKSRLGKAPIVIDSDDSDDDDQEHDSTKFDDFILGMQRKLIVQDVMKELMSKSYVLPKPHKANLQTAWDKFVCSPMDFRTFKTVFPPVPRQNLRSNFLVLAKQPSNERV
uniref:Uncharacterized protein n=1 Tax=Oryza rufipogon TaxID=4529 RepID=A0A0E0P582_ORYRU